MHNLLPVKCLLFSIALAVIFPTIVQGQLHQQGYASYYGARFQGRKTANGERFDMHTLTAAHRTLPFGTIVKVSRLDNGSFVFVRINDRGPFVRGRIIDLSVAAAKVLKMIRHGKKKVSVELVNGKFTVDELMAGALEVDSIFLISNKPKRKRIQAIWRVKSRSKVRPYLVKMPKSIQYAAKTGEEGGWLKTIVQKIFRQ